MTLCSQTISQLESLVQQDGYNPFLGTPVPLNSKTRNGFVQQVEQTAAKPGNALILEEEGGALNGALLLEPLPFDSDLYGFPMGKISFIAASGDYEKEKKVRLSLLQKAFQRAQKEGMRHLSVRALPDQMAQIHALEESGFYMVAGLATFALELKKRERFESKKGVLIRAFQPEDLKPLSELSRLSFGNPKDWLDKAHADPNLSKEKSDELYVRWFQNCCKGEQADHVLVAEIDGKPVGYIALKIEKGLAHSLGWHIGNIPLNAVSPDYRQRGIYSGLVQAGLDWFEGKVDWVTIKTQVTTMAVHKTWLKLGAQMSAVEYAFHHYVK